MTSRTFLNFDGTYSVRVSACPVNYVAADGTMQPVDTHLAASTKDGFAAQSEANTLKCYLPGTANGWARVETGDDALAFQPQGATGAPATFSGNEDDMPGAWNQATLTYTVLPGQLKESITLSGADAPASFGFVLRLEGLTARLNADNSVSLLDSTGQTAFFIQAPWMLDAARRRSTAISVALRPVEGGLAYTETLDPAWLAAAAYPVVVDPSIIVPNPTATGVGDSTDLNSSTYGELSPGISYVSNSGYTPGDSLVAGTDQYGSSKRVFRSALKFGAQASSIGLPADAEINSATLRLGTDTAQNTGYDAPSMLLQAYDLPLSDTITWNHIVTAASPSGSFTIPGNSDTFPVTTFASPTVSFQPSNAGYNDIYFDVTDIVQTWTDKVTSPLSILVRQITGNARDEHPVNEEDKILLNVLVFHPYIDDTLEINYSQLGWTMLQGNKRHTGRIQSSITGTSRWTSPVALDVVTGYTADIGPAVLAVPDATDASKTIIYAAVVRDPGSPITSKIYRLVDLGTGATPVVTTPQQLPVVVTGTPLLYSGKLFVTGNFASGSGGYLYAMDASTLAFSWSPASRVFSGSCLTSPTPDPANGGVLVIASDSSNQVYLYCINPANGNDLWTPQLLTYGNVETFSSPVVTHRAIYVASTRALSSFNSFETETRDLLTGQLIGGASQSYASARGYADSSIRLGDNRLELGSRKYYSTDYNGFISEYLVNPYDLTPLSSYTSPQLDEVFHLYGFPVTGGSTTDLDPVWSTPAWYGESHTIVGCDEQGRTFGLISNDVTSHGRTPFSSSYGRWSDTAGFGGTLVHSSPLIAGTRGGSAAYAFIGADDGLIRRYQVYPTPPIGFPNTPTVINTGAALDGKIRAPLAAYNGRLYVITNKGKLYSFQ